MKRTLALLLCILMLFSLAGCGDKKGGKGEVEGEVQTSGNLSVFVPKGMKIVPGDLLDTENPDALTVEEEDDPLTYVIISINELEWIEYGMETTKDINSDCEFTDCSIPLSNGTFEGFSYESFGSDCFEFKCKLANVYIQITGAGFETDDAVLLKILESITVLSGGTATEESEDDSWLSLGDDFDEKINGIADETETTEVQDMWNGWWYGGLDINGCTGGWEWINNTTYDSTMYVELDENGVGTMYLYEYGQIFDSEIPNCFAAIDCHADTNYLYGDSGTSFGYDIETYDWIFVHYLDNAGKIGTGTSFTDEDGDRFGYDLTYMKWGSYWEGEEGYTCFLPGFEDYIERIEDGQIDPYGSYADDSDVDQGGASSDGSGNSELLGSNPTKLDINNHGIIVVYYPGDEFEYDDDYGKIKSKTGGASILFDPCLGDTNYEEYKEIFSGDSYKEKDDYEIYETTINGYPALVCTGTDWLSSSMDVVIDFGGEHDGYYGLRFAVSGDSIDDCQTDLVWAVIGSFELLK